MKLTDGVIVLRPWAAADVDEVVRMSNEPEVARWTRVPEPNTPADVRAFFAAAAGGAQVAVAARDTGALLGSAGVVRAAPDEGRAEIGYWIGAEHRGRGVAARAVALLSDWAFTQGFTRLELHIDPENAASRRVAEKAGYTLEGVLRSYEELKGRRVDIAMYARIAG